jgi:hypothetical protein
MYIYSILVRIGKKPMPSLGKKYFEKVLPFWSVEIDSKNPEEIIRGMWGFAFISALLTYGLGLIFGGPLPPFFMFIVSFAFVWIYLFLSLLSIQQEYVSDIDDITPLFISELKWKFDAERSLTEAMFGVLSHLDSFLHSLTKKIRIRLCLGEDPWEVLEYLGDTQPSEMLRVKISEFAQLRGDIEIELKDEEFIEKFEDHLNFLEDQFSLFVAMSSLLPTIIILFVLIYGIMNPLILAMVPLGHFILTKIMFLFMKSNQMKVLGW